MSASPLAIICSDVHFSERASVARSAEPDWYEAMSRPWRKIKSVAKDLQVPVIIAGDIFDHWKPSPRLINFAMDMLNGLEVYAVPGQHDLPDHNYDEMYRSGYGTLVQAKSIINIESEVHIPGAVLYGFPWGREITPLQDKFEDAQHIAVIHRYIWKDGHGYFGASQDSWIGAYRRALAGYDLAVFGDNHSGFAAKPRAQNLPTIFNCGCVVPRRIDEINYQPRFGVYYSDGRLDLVDFPIENDKWFIEAAPLATETEGAKEFIDKLVDLSSDSLDFREVVKRFTESSVVKERVKALVLSALDPNVDEGQLSSV